jgi:hypothetical protein
MCHPYEKGRQFLINVESKYIRLYCVTADNGNIHILRHGTLNVARIDIYSRYSYGTETWTLRAVYQKHLDSFEMWCWRRMEKISWTDHVRN